jgi:hypothetical protein
MGLLPQGVAAARLSYVSANVSGLVAVADTELIARHHHEPLGGVELRLAVVRQQLHVVVLSAEPALLIQADRR